MCIRDSSQCASARGKKYRKHTVPVKGSICKSLEKTCNVNQRLFWVSPWVVTSEYQSEYVPHWAHFVRSSSPPGDWSANSMTTAILYFSIFAEAASENLKQ
eukprot:5442720-Amphidinium_carterae.1